MELKVKKLHPDAVLPKYASEGAACFDLHALEDADDSSKEVEFAPESACTFRTGLSFEVPPGWAMMVYSRSGHGFRNGVRLSNCVGVIDSDYRGEVMVRLHNEGNDWFNVKKGDRIAQSMLIPVPKVTIVEAEELSETARGAGGFGSTGS
jgi:dUTP pyrophosphatase